MRDGRKEYIERIDEDYAKSNMTIIVIPKDTTIKTSVISDIENVSPTTKASNVSHTLLRANLLKSDIIDDDDILYTTVAALRVNGTAWLKFLQTKMKLSIYRVEGDVSFKADGTIVPTATSHSPINIEIPRKSCRDGVWIEHHYIFDDNWKLHEANQKIYITTEHTSGNGSGSVTATVGIGWKDGSATVEANLTAEFTLNFNKHAIKRTDNELSRAAMLATNVENLGAGVYNINNTNFCIRRYSDLDIVYNFYYTLIK